MIRVLHFASIINPNDIIDVVLARLDRTRFEPHVLLGSKNPALLRSASYSIRTLDRAFGPRTYPQMFFELVRHIKKLRPHIVQAHHYHENVVAAAAVQMAGVPAYVIGRHYSDHIYFLTRGAKQRAFLAAEAYCNRRAVRISVPTSHVADVLTSRQRVPAAKIRIVPFGVPLAAYDAAREARARMRARIRPDDGPIVVACGRINAEKGFEHLMSAAPRIVGDHDAAIVFVGDGPELPRLREMAGAMKLKRPIQFVGWQRNAAEWLAAADVVVNPAYCESFCQVLVESVAVGTPVVMTPVGIAGELIGNNERGRLVPFAAPDAIAGAVGELLGDAALRSNVARLAREYVARHLSPERSAAENESLYLDALATG